MSTSSTKAPTSASHDSSDLRLQVWDEPSTEQVNGAWWPRSRDLQREGADLVDHFPVNHGRISRMLFSRPDWDDSSVGDRGVRSVRASTRVVKVGSFPRDDTHLMILTMSSGRRLNLLVIPSDTPDAEAEQRLHPATGTSGDHDRPSR